MSERDHCSSRLRPARQCMTNLAHRSVARLAAHLTSIVVRLRCAGAHEVLPHNDVAHPSRSRVAAVVETANTLSFDTSAAACLTPGFGRQEVCKSIDRVNWAPE